MTAYYTQLDKTETDGIVTARFIPNEPAQGAWNPHEQHMAPASGLLARELEQFSPRDDMRIGRISFDIFWLNHLRRIYHYHASDTPWQNHRIGRVVDASRGKNLY